MDFIDDLFDIFIQDINEDTLETFTYLYDYLNCNVHKYALNYLKPLFDSFNYSMRIDK